MDSAIPFLMFVPSSPAHAIYSQGGGNPSFNLGILTMLYFFKKRGTRWMLKRGTRWMLMSTTMRAVRMFNDAIDLPKMVIIGID